MKRFSKFCFIFLMCLFFTSSNLYGKLGVNNIVNASVYNSYNQVTNQKKIKNLAIFIKFSDSDVNVVNHLDDEKSVSNAQMIYNSDELIEMNSVNGIIKVPSFKKYYEKQSYGKLSITTEFFPKEGEKVVSYQDSNPIGYYLKYSSTNPNGYKSASEMQQRETQLINNAISSVSSQIESSGISSKDIDYDEDEVIDAITFIVEGQKNLPVAISWNDLLWSHMKSNNSITSTIMGKKIISYNLLYAKDYTEAASLFSLNRGNYGVIIHEFGHMLGYLDLYRYNSQAKPVGFFDIMGNTEGTNPQSFLTYNISEFNIQNKWHDEIPVIRETTKGITLQKPQFVDPQEKRAIKIKVDDSSNEFFVVEYYEKQNTYESYTTDSSGIIVYRVNEDSRSNNGENDHIFVFRPNETSLGASAGDLDKATLNMQRPKLGSDLNLNDMSFNNKSIYYSDGSNSGIKIEVTSETSESVTFDVYFPDLFGTGTKSNPYLISDASSFLYLMKLGTSNKYYKIVSDLDFKNVSSYPSLTFVGYLDGNNKTIRNVKSSYGIFETVGTYDSSTVIENLNIENITVNGSGNYLGGFASNVENAIIRNVHLKSGQVMNIQSSNSLSSTGGFAGNVFNDVTIENCSSFLSVNSPKNAGGFIGLNQNAILNNLFVSSSVNGSENIGAFIALQSITDNTYNVPQNVFYEVLSNENTKVVGGYSTFHNLKALDASSLSKGIVGVSIPKKLEIMDNSSINYTITTNPSINVNSAISVSDANIIQYENNKIVGKKGGNAKVYVDLSIGSMKMRLTTDVIVKSSTPSTPSTPTKPTEPIVVSITSVKINENNPTVVVGNTAKLTATITPSNTTQSKDLTWITSNKEIATVDQNGVVKGIKAGTTNITVKTSNGKTSTINLTVKKAIPIKSVKLNKKTLKIKANSSVKLKATINPSNTTASKVLTWSSSNKKVVVVDKNGKITAKSAGTAKITVKTSNGKKATVKVTVTKINAKKAKISAIKNQVQTGKSLKPAITVKLGKTTLKKGRDYTVSYKNNKNAGKATVTVKFKGNYYGSSKKKTFLIIPKKVNIKKPSTSKKAITVKYSKVSGAKIYKIAYRIKGTKKWKYTTSKSLSKKIKKLSSRKKYEVVVKAGIRNKGKTLYGAWSDTKVIKVK